MTFQAEELIKQEMAVMLHHDAVYSPTLAQQGIMPGSKKPPSQKTIANQAQHLGYLENHRYEKFSQNDIEEVSLLLFVTNFLD